MLKESHNHLVAWATTAGLWFIACSAAGAQQKTPPLSEKDWQKATTTIREIALDKKEAEGHRANAVTAYVKLLLWKKRHDDALKFCREVLKSASKTAVAAAALRVGCLVERNRHGHLRAELNFLASSSRGAHRHVASTISQQLNRTVQMLTSLGAKAMVPRPVVPRFPHWAAAGPGKAPQALNVAALVASTPRWYPPPGKAPDVFRVTLPKIRPPTWYRFQPGRAHPALHVVHPKMEPPHWYRRVPFPPLKQPKK